MNEVSEYMIVGVVTKNIALNICSMHAFAEAKCE